MYTFHFVCHNLTERRVVMSHWRHIKPLFHVFLLYHFLPVITQLVTLRILNKMIVHFTVSLFLQTDELFTMNRFLIFRVNLIFYLMNLTLEVHCLLGKAPSGKLQANIYFIFSSCSLTYKATRLDSNFLLFISSPVIYFLFELIKHTQTVTEIIEKNQKATLKSRYQITLFDSYSTFLHQS